MQSTASNSQLQRPQRDESVYVRAFLERCKPWIQRECSNLSTANKTRLMLDLHQWLGAQLEALSDTTIDYRDAS